MGLIRIDRDKCNKDGICAAECPLAIIKMNAEDGFPEIVAGGEGACLGCGHCVVICPKGALSNERSPLAESPEIDKNLVLDESGAVQFLRSRRSVRIFKDKPVEKEKIERLIRIGRYAPSAGNVQPVRWLVIDDKEKMKKIGGMVVDNVRKMLEKDPTGGPAPYLPLIVAAWDMGFDAVLRDAPALITAFAPKQDFNGMVDVSLALSYLELAAPTLGLGTCWAGLLEGALKASPELAKFMGLPEGHPWHYPMMIGYPKFKYYRLPERKEPDILWR